MTWPPGNPALRRLLLLVLFAALGAGSADEIRQAETLVHQVWIEGIPYEAAHALTPNGVARLAEILDDPAEARWHANVVSALGMSGQAAALPALVAFAAREPQGELDRDAYRARMALPFAFGHLARDDARAAAWLESALARNDSPSWRFKYLQGDRLREQLHTMCINALGIAGRVERLRALERSAQDAIRPGGPATPAASRHVEEIRQARALAERVARDGPAAVFGDRGGGVPPQ